MHDLSNLPEGVMDSSQVIRGGGAALPEVVKERLASVSGIRISRPME